MIRTPISTKPKITKDDVSNGFIKRYFAKTASSPTIYEINNTQYNYYKTDRYFQTLELVWLITGNSENTISRNGNIIYGVRHQNEKIIEYYNKKMPGLRRVLKNPLEYFSGVYNVPEVPFVNAPATIQSSISTTNVEAEVIPPLVTSGLMLNYDYSNLACYSAGGASGTITDLSGNAINTNYNSGFHPNLSYNSSDYGGGFDFAPLSDPGNAESKIDLSDGMTIPPYSAAPYFAANPTFTLDFWIKPRVRNPALSGGYTILGSVSATGAGRLTVQAVVPPTAGTAYFRINKGAFGINTADFQSYYTFTAGSPINVTFTKTGFVYQLYVNGQFKGEVTDGTSTTYNTGNHCLGQNWNPGAAIGQKSVEKFDGSMYTFLAYDRVLTATEVLQNYNSQKARFGL